MLLTRYDMENRTGDEAEDWHSDAFRLFDEKMSDPIHKFPCIPATIGHKLGHLRYGFLEDPKEVASASKLAALLEQYGAESRAFGSYTSLIAIFKTPADLVRTHAVDDYRLLFWELLSKVHAYDVKEWPSDIPTDPDHHVWEYCFGGEKYFMYCATPAHHSRVSRSFPYFLFAITPRWVLDRFNANPKTAASIKRQIRDRIVDYDGLGIHPDLNQYGSEHNFEWKQYFLGDDSKSAAEAGLKCPFAHLHSPKK
ncbi:YqcI/YcgG family protein [Paenibacillus soyae]|uniref:YqcI/YcgG family protein n=1 Tax=Paenibacillus soyae TaxID=2969249 RepID=A0A9X2MQ63_9BACL|nr:YqcI/YcgG family protein [Paenibacillus soyae]MCR2803838.1 YqcI/YcgG family protein [Paenibacillus soyae]